MSSLQEQVVSRSSAALEPATGMYAYVGTAIIIGFWMAVAGYWILQIWLLATARGKRRRMASIPLWIMAPILVYTIIAYRQGSNLFPILLIFASPFAFAYLVIIARAKDPNDEIS